MALDYHVRWSVKIWPERGLASDAYGMRLAIVLVLFLCAACTQVHGSLPPSTFKFKTIVPHEGPGRGGWQAAQVIILMHRISVLLPQGAVCEVEVGVPLVNWRGPVSVSFVQQQSAIAADLAARRVMRKKLPSGLMCIQFREVMEASMDNRGKGPVPGTRVSTFISKGLPRTTFPQ